MRGPASIRIRITTWIVTLMILWAGACLGAPRTVNPPADDDVGLCFEPIRTETVVIVSCEPTEPAGVPGSPASCGPSACRGELPDWSADAWAAANRARPVRRDGGRFVLVSKALGTVELRL